jgi:Fe-S-cluster containining protein
MNAPNATGSVQVGPYIFPEPLHYSCNACGKCCRSFRVEVTPEFAAGLRGRVSNRHGFTDPFDVEADGRVFLRQVDDACVFLLPDEKCGIHAELGYEAKPPSCRRFPFSLYRVPSGALHVRASFFCPTVIASKGAAPEELAKGLASDGSPIELPNRHRTEAGEISNADYAELEHDLDSILASEGDISRAVAIAGSLVARVVRRMAEGGAPLEEVREYRDPANLEALASVVRPFENVRRSRFLLAPFLWTAVPPQLGRMTHTLNMARLLLGRGSVVTVLSTEPVDLGRHAAVSFDSQMGESSVLVRRYLRHILKSRALIHDLGADLGFYLLGVAFALVRWYARALAALAGRTAVTDADVIQAIRTVDRFHLGHNQGHQYVVKRTLMGRGLAYLVQSPALFSGLVLEQ